MREMFDIDNPVMIWLIKIFDCICVSLLWPLFSLPVVTMGAASVALYATVYKFGRARAVCGGPFEARSGRIRRGLPLCG